MVDLTTVGFEPAGDFPQRPYESVHLRLARFAQDSTLRPTWRQFAGAWNAVAYRFQACVEHDEGFREVFARLGSNAGGLDRYAQERDTHECVVNACSVIEAFYYGAHAVGGLIDPTAFQMDSWKAQKKVEPLRTATAFEARFPDDPMTKTLGQIVLDPAWADLNDIRNVLVHRAAWSKDVFRAAGEGGPGQADRVRFSDYYLADRDFGPALTSDPRKWVAENLSLLCAALDTFTERELQPPGDTDPP